MEVYLEVGVILSDEHLLVDVGVVGQLLEAAFTVGL
jgi:hypothetical protein